MWSPACPRCFTPGKNLVPTVQEVGWTSRAVWTARNTLPTLEFDPWTIQPISRLLYQPRTLVAFLLYHESITISQTHAQITEGPYSEPLNYSLLNARILLLAEAPFSLNALCGEVFSLSDKRVYT
jgi:hypothetical protein